MNPADEAHQIILEIAMLGLDTMARYQDALCQFCGADVGNEEHDEDCLSRRIARYIESTATRLTDPEDDE